LVFDTPRRPGVNDIKPAVETRELLMKAYQARRVVATTVILGSSRTDIALDPTSPAWPAALRPVYNLSIAGGGVETGLQYLQHMLESRPQEQRPKALVVGIDFEDYLVAADPPSTAKADSASSPSEAWRKRLLLDANGKPNAAHRAQSFDDHLAAALSLDAL